MKRQRDGKRGKINEKRKTEVENCRQNEEGDEYYICSSGDLFIYSSHLQKHLCSLKVCFLLGLFKTFDVQKTDVNSWDYRCVGISSYFSTKGSISAKFDENSDCLCSDSIGHNHPSVKILYWHKVFSLLVRAS